MDKIFESVRQFFSQLFVSSSPEAYDINNLFLKFLILAAIIVALIAGLVIYSSIFFSAKRRPAIPPQVFGHKTLELIWTIVPLMIVTFFFFLTFKSMREINQPFQQGRKPDIVVIAHQWWWDMRYPEENVITANELHIPVGKKLLMQIRSADVIHSWWVPDLGRKTDAIPGHINYSWIEADKPGIYSGTCSEYCGTQHAWMRIRVIAESQADFDKWIKEQQQVPKMPTDSIAILGAELFQKKTCASCHAILGTPAQSHIGPDLSHFASRQTILSGMFDNNMGSLQRWLINPQNVKEGSHMPNFMLNPKEIEALSTYLEGLK